MPLRLRVTFGCLITCLVPGLGGGPKRMALWGVILLGSLLAHELGHALAGLAFGSRAAMTLHPLGGATRFDPPLSRSRSILATLAGPASSLTIGLVFAALRPFWGSAPWLPMVMWVNLGWGALNLLPVLPFDGGRAVLELAGSGHASRALPNLPA